MDDSFDGIDWSDGEHEDWLWDLIGEVFAAFDPDDPEGSRARISAIDENDLTCVWETFAAMKSEEHLAEPDRQALETFSRIEALFK
jgi:hypothetical protein